jgi:hypothetical protein
MEPNPLTQELMLLLEKEVGETGPSILKKQCEDLGIDVKAIAPYDIRRLVGPIFEAIRFYTGDKRANQITDGMLEYGNALETVASPNEAVMNRINAHLLIADKKLYLGMVEEAEAVINNAKSLLRDLKSPEREECQVKVGRHLGRVLTRDRKRAKEAISEFESVITLGEKIGSHYDVALSWNGMGAMA